MKQGYRAIKEANPKASVGIAGMAYWADARWGGKLFLDRLLDVADGDAEAKANGYFFDFLPFHIYSSPYNVYSVAGTYRTILAHLGLGTAVCVATFADDHTERYWLVLEKAFSFHLGSGPPEVQHQIDAFSMFGRNT